MKIYGEEKDLQQVIDEADALVYGNLASQLKKDLESKVEVVVEKSPEPIRNAIRASSENLYEKMEQFSKTEQEHIPSPETWVAYEPKHEAIKENLQKLQTAQEKPDAEQEVQAAGKQAVTSFQQASAFLQAQQEKLVERERQLQLEMKQIKHMMVSMNELLQGVPLEERTDLASHGGDFVSDIELLRKDIRSLKPVVAAAVWKEAHDHVHQVYTDIREIPNKVKTAIQDKAYHIVDRVVQKTASILNKGIQYLCAKREEVLNLSPLEIARQAENGKDFQQMETDVIKLTMERLAEEAKTNPKTREFLDRMKKMQAEALADLQKTALVAEPEPQNVPQEATVTMESKAEPVLQEAIAGAKTEPAADKDSTKFVRYAQEAAKAPKNDTIEKVVQSVVRTLVKDKLNHAEIVKILKSCKDSDVQRIGQQALKLPDIRKAVLNNQKYEAASR